MNLLYNQWLDKDLLRVHYSNQIYNHSEELILRIIKKRFKRKNEIRVADFGAGYGNFCSIALKLGFKTYAFDLSSDKADQMESRGITTINNFDKFKNYFDLIWVNQVFEHVSDPGSIIESLRECLTDNGIIFISTPNCRKIRRTIRKKELSLELFQKLSPHQHINAFTHKSLVKLGETHLLKSFSLTDYLKFFNLHLTRSELLKLGKVTLKCPFFGTNIFFSKI